MVEQDIVCVRVGCDWVADVWDFTAHLSKLADAVGKWLVIVVVLMLCGCSEVRPFIHCDHWQLDQMKRVEVGLKGKF